MCKSQANAFSVLIYISQVNAFCVSMSEENNPVNIRIHGLRHSGALSEESDNVQRPPPESENESHSESGAS